MSPRWPLCKPWRDSKWLLPRLECFTCLQTEPKSIPLKCLWLSPNLLFHHSLKVQIHYTSKTVVSTPLRKNLDKCLEHMVTLPRPSFWIKTETSQQLALLSLKMMIHRLKLLRSLVQVLLLQELKSQLAKLEQEIIQIVLSREEREPYSLAISITTWKTGKLRTSLANWVSLNVCHSQNHQKAETEASDSSHSKMLMMPIVLLRNLVWTSMEEASTLRWTRSHKDKEETPSMTTDLKDSETKWVITLWHNTPKTCILTKECY